MENSKFENLKSNLESVELENRLELVQIGSDPGLYKCSGGGSTGPFDPTL